MPASRLMRLGPPLLAALAVAACSATPPSRGAAVLRRAPAKAAAAAAASGTYKLGVPYEINGRVYYPEYDPHYERVGVASWYGADFDGLPTANGETFDRRLITAAHPTLPLPSIVRVTNLRNGRTLDVRVNDRGPFVDDRLIDLSEGAARQLGYENAGLAQVKVQFVRLAPANGTPPAPTTMLASAAPSSPPRPPAGVAPPVRTAAIPPPRELGALPAPGRASLPPQPVQPPQPPPIRSAGLRKAPPAVRTPPAPPVVCRAGPYTIHIGAFGETDAVQAASATLRGLGRLTIEPAFAQGRALARVRLGPAPNRTLALQVLERVRTLGYPGAIAVPLNPAAPVISC